MHRTTPHFVILAALLALVPAQQSAAQGAGSTGAQVLQFVAGSRAAALSGAYTAASSDADALFYNPAGVAALQRAAAISYEAYVEGVALASFGGVLNLGRFTIGLSELLLDAGDINERVPDPEFGGNRGISTGRVLSASESVTRITAATPRNGPTARGRFCRRGIHHDRGPGHERSCF